MRDVNFFIVGAPKCATTSVSKYLESHPMVFMSNPKEINYFSSEDIKKQLLYYKEKIVECISDYEKVFSMVKDEKIIGDSSVSYFYYSGVPKRISEYNSHSKILIILRDPVERAYSHYLMDKRLGYVKEPLEDIFYNKNKFPLHFQQYFQVSLYYSPVKRYISHFSEHNVKIILDSEIKKDSKLVFEQLSAFLEIKKIEYGTDRQHNAYKAPKNIFYGFLYSSGVLRRILQKLLPRKFSNKLKTLIFKNSSKPSLDPNFIKEMYSFFKEDIVELENLIKKDLSFWYKDQTL